MDRKRPRASRCRTRCLPRRRSCRATPRGVGSAAARATTGPSPSASLANGASATITLVAQVNAALFGAVLTNTATVSSASLDPSLLNNTATATVSICSFTINPLGASVGAAAGNGALAVTAAAAGCSWTAVSNSLSVPRRDRWRRRDRQWHVTYSYTVQSRVSPRVGSIAISGQTFTLTQAGVAPPAGEIQLRPRPLPSARRLATRLSRSHGPVAARAP